MKIAVPQNQFFDDQGLPLVAGRISVFYHDSDTLADVFWLECGSYTDAENPVLCDDAGRIETLFFDAALVDVKVEKRNADGTYEQIDVFQTGFEMPDGKNDTSVWGIAGLKDAAVSLGIVGVWGYDSYCMAPYRHYIWDGNCNTAENGGTIIKSNNNDTGRWLLLWDDEKLPCTIFGITPGHETNISAFIGYGDFVGTYQVRMPPVRRFLSGTYTSNTTFSGSVKLYFDRGACFQYASFNVLGAEIEPVSNYVADFTFGSQYEAHSAWFRTAQSFYSCGAKRLVNDYTFYWQSYDITSIVTISNTLLECYTNAPTLTFTSGAYLYFTNCTFLGTPLRVTNYYYFSGCIFSDNNFMSASASDYDFGTAGSHKIQVDNAYNTVQVQNFKDPDVYVRWALQQGLTALDLQGRSCSGFTSTFSAIKNVACTGTIMIDVDVILDNVSAALKVDNCAVIAKNCSLSFDVPDNIATSISIYGGVVYGYVDASSAIYMADCVFANTASIPPTTESDVTLERVSVAAKSSSETFGGKHLRFKGCTIRRTVDIRPYKSGSTYYFDVIIDGNLFLDDGWLNFNANNDPAIYGIITNWFTITNNTFDGNGDIAMPYIAADGVHKFLGAVSGFVYGGNKGSTIRETGPETFNSTTMTRTHTFGAKDYNITVDTWRVFNLNNNDVFQSYRDNGDYGYRLGGYADDVFGDAVLTYGETLVHNKAISNVYNDQFLVAEAWADQDGYASGKYIFFGD